MADVEVTQADRDLAVHLTGDDDKITTRPIAKFRIEATRIAAAELQEARAEVARLKGFVEGINNEWIEFKSEENDDYDDGYSDCLGSLAQKARNTLTTDAGGS